MARGLLYLTLWGMQLLLIAVLATPAWMSAQVEAEKASVDRFLGETTAQDLERRVDALFRLTMVDSGLIRAVERTFLPDPNEPQMAGREVPLVFSFMRRSLRTFWFVVYQSMYRFLLLMEWVPFLGAMIGAAFLDGLVARRINQRAMRYANPVRYRSGMRVMVALLVVPAFYLSVPFNVPPAIVPVWFFALSGVLILVIANAQHRI